MPLSLANVLPRRLRARFTLIAIASAGTMFLCIAPLTLWFGERFLVGERIREVETRLDAVLSRGDADLRTVHQQALGLSDILPQWRSGDDSEALELIRRYVRHLPKAYGVRLAFEPDSRFASEGGASLYLKRNANGQFEQVIIPYAHDDPASPGGTWYLPAKNQPADFADARWSDIFAAPESAPEKVLSCVVAIQEPTGEQPVFAGVVAIDVASGTIRDLLGELRIAPSFQAYLIQPDRKVSIAAVSADTPAGLAADIYALGERNPLIFGGFTALQNPDAPDGWFIARNPVTGEKSCFFYERLRHSRAQVLYVVPMRYFAQDRPYLLGGLFLLGVFSIGGMGLLLRWSAGIVTRNLDVLLRGVGQVSAGNLREKLPPAVAHDETADVIDAFNDMVGELEQAFHRAEELARRQQRADTELELARFIQLSALPAAIAIPGGRIRGLTLPAQQVGGDFYDAFVLPGGRAALAVGDVSGKGVSAALFMVRASLLLRAAAAVMSPADALAQVNAALVKSNPAMMFVTFFFAVWNPVKGRLTCANAGHNPPLLLRADGALETLVKRSGPALGALPGQDYPTFEVAFGVGDLLAVYSDGITEAPSPDGEQFGAGRLHELLAPHASWPLAELAKRTVTEVENWQGESERFDDITLLLAEATDMPRAHTFPADLETLEQVVAAVQAHAREAGFGDRDAQQLALAACEVATNIITYGLDSDPARIYRLFSATCQQAFILRFEDDGGPFDPNALPPVDLSATLDTRPVGGLGWVLIRKAVDDVTMERVADTNILTLLRHLPDGGIS
ncbi:SpoIIE family protein phosphatase [uncultured Thiocystis sp.]|jgi:serine phosphatase RsbU (regulator of sigma subunit)/anti-sigma regulatory factor (Ser/Thr protein kinase)|uniref:SpoIIE family protein phosphatase n=1 Tax=uncultured Thiocystis sp. TaxID=1202134 RepID=UPI0025DD34A3|nr:SpoIIE family protein phosphatase [uncultured Thiocystis sp.]